MTCFEDCIHHRECEHREPNLCGVAAPCSCFPIGPNDCPICNGKIWIYPTTVAGACARLQADLDARVADIIRSAPLNRLIPGPDKSPEDLATEIRRAHAELTGHSDPTDRILLLCHPDARSDLEPVVAGLPPGGYRVVETETIPKDKVDVLFVPGRHPPLWP